MSGGGGSNGCVMDGVLTDGCVISELCVFSVLSPGSVAGGIMAEEMSLETISKLPEKSYIVKTVQI